jgi:hypothetical protein
VHCNAWSKHRLAQQMFHKVWIWFYETYSWTADPSEIPSEAAPLGLSAGEAKTSRPVVRAAQQGLVLEPVEQG